MATTFTVGSGNTIRPYRNVRIQNFPEDASQTFKKGYPLIFSSTSGKENKVKEAGADPTAKMVGIAGADASGTEGTMIPVYLFAPDAEFVINAGDTMTLSYSDISAGYGIVKDSTNLIWRLDTTETTAKVFTVLQLLDASGDINARAVVRPTTATMKQTFGVN